MISCRADLFKHINKAWHPAEIHFWLDISLRPENQFWVEHVKFSDEKDQNDETMDGCLEWLSNITDELFMPIKEQLDTKRSTASNVTIQEAQNWIKFMQERLSHLPRIKVEPNFNDTLKPSSEPDDNGAYQMVHTYIIYVQVQENK
jgi:hypothetical protein